ncbi:MAG TPA: AMP-binding protein [Desulfomonilaceae bacterium]|nr:AMP-binding protein [Desulfomonilaceae bacterium]
MIKARVRAENPEANLKSYYETYQSFRWSDVEASLFHTENGQINIVQDAIDKWADDPVTRNKPAIIFEKAGQSTSFTYAEMKERSCRWANLLTKYNFKIGDRVFIFLRPCPEIYFAMLACARIGVIFSVLYPALGFEELGWRILDAEPRGLITHPDLVGRLPENAMQDVKHVFLTDGPKMGLFSGEVILDQVAEHMPEECDIRFLPPETPLYLLYTSGSTGPPKGVVHAHHDMAGHLITGRYVLDLTESSVLWTDGEPAWVTGTVYGAFAPWLCGATSIIQGSQFDASQWYRTLEIHRVTTWYTTPRSVRRLMQAGKDLPRQYDLSHLRHIATVGETLLPELFYWVRENLKHSPHDTWWMTETGMICMANFPSQLIKPGSMGKPVPGVEAAVLDQNGEQLSILTLGELALKSDLPCLMRAVWRDEARFTAYFRNGWFLTGDMVIKDEDGYYYHQGRNDDLIKLGQNFVGPYDFEQVVGLHRAVAEAAVISKNATPGEVEIKVFVKVNRGFPASESLNLEIQNFVKNNFADLPSLEIEFIDELPKTRSGKVLRRVLRARELGLPSGDPLNLKD